MTRDSLTRLLMDFWQTRHPKAAAAKVAALLDVYAAAAMRSTLGPGNATPPRKPPARASARHRKG